MADHSSQRDGSDAELPPPDQRLAVTLVPPPHPATLDPGELLKRCELRAQRRSGPGGQHRNKTSSGIFLKAVDWGIVGEATERRSQAQNRAAALVRLRFRLAVELRSPSVLDAPTLLDQPLLECERQLSDRFAGTRLKLADSNPAKPGLLAIVLNDLHAAGGQPRRVAARWRCSTTSIVSLVRSHPPAFALLNKIRQHHDRPPLKA